MSFKDFLNENPQEIESFDSMTIENAVEIFTKNFNEYKFSKEYNGLVIKTNSLKATDFLVFEVQNDKPVAGVYFVQSGVYKSGVENFSYIPKFSLNWKGKKGFLFDAYKTFSKYKKNAYIMSDGKQTKDSKKIWIKWYKEERGISEIFMYNYDKKEELAENTKIEQLWGNEFSFRKYRVVAKFK